MIVMIKSRQEIKLQARESLKLNGNRGTAIAIILIYMVTASIPMFLITPLIGGIGEQLGDLVINVFMMVVGIGICSEFMKVYRGEKANVGGMFSGFEFFGRNILTVALMLILIVMWIVPGVIAYVLTENIILSAVLILLALIPMINRILAYFAVLYILSESKEIGIVESINLSKRMTEGHKMEIFVMNLSFIGWYTLGFFTCGILTLVFVMPYHYSADAGLYMEIRDEAIADMRITAEELK